MKKISFIILTVLSVFSFGQNKPNDFIKTFENELNNWKITFQNFSLIDFEKTTSINTSDINFSYKSFNELSNIDKKFGYFSPNKETFINAFSFLNIEVENGKYKENPDIDQSIEFFYIDKNKSKEIIFCGSSEGIDEVVYVTEKLVLFVGSKFENENREPIIFILDLNNNTLDKFENSKSKQIKQYKSDKIKEVKI